jgi:hypothetical protein
MKHLLIALVQRYWLVCWRWRQTTPAHAAPRFSLRAWVSLNSAYNSTYLGQRFMKIASWLCRCSLINCASSTSLWQAPFSWHAPFSCNVCRGAKSGAVPYRPAEGVSALPRCRVRASPPYSCRHYELLSDCMLASSHGSGSLPQPCRSHAEVEKWACIKCGSRHAEGTTYHERTRDAPEPAAPYQPGPPPPPSAWRTQRSLALGRRRHAASGTACKPPQTPLTEGCRCG